MSFLWVSHWILTAGIQCVCSSSPRIHVLYLCMFLIWAQKCSPSVKYSSALSFKQGSVQSFTPSPVEYHSSGLISNSPVLSGSYSSGISSLSRCSTSETSGFESQGSEPAVTVSSYSVPEEPVRKESKTPPPYSVYERTLKRPVPLPHSLSIPPATDPPALPPKPQLVRTNNLENSSRRTEQVPRPRPLPRKVSQLWEAPFVFNCNQSFPI